MVLCEKNYSKRIAYSYLEDIAQEFHSLYGRRVNSVTRPYSFIEFSMYHFPFSILYFIFYNLVFILYLKFFFQIHIFKKQRKFFWMVGQEEI